ncbi:hypothetical protein P3T76_006489 [Phytophthora citrophthora]|uniref:Integrase catalytic domain-containing protein n=1 Tax=Phytophthora citrophthora TaxID=4793 RepID=A0AAD9GP57_9STRA|nr:hypothetical protein P3T76_006489 [Phytophthora citrophthora]
MRLERIAQAQGEEKWIADLRTYLTGDVADLAAKDARTCAKIAESYEVDDDGLLLYCPHCSSIADEDRDAVTKLVTHERLRQDFLHHYHASLEGGLDEHTPGSSSISLGEACFATCNDMWVSVWTVRLEKEDLSSYHSRKIARKPAGHVPVPYHCHGSHAVAAEVVQRNTELLIWADLFTGYVLAKTSGARTAQQIAESYEESVPSFWCERGYSA